MDDIPSVLRAIFKDTFQKKYHQPWADNRASGSILMKNDHWQARLVSPQTTKLKNGNTQHWDSTLLFHVLLHSSMVLFATELQGTKCIVTVQAKRVVASVPSFDFQKVLKSGDKVIFDLDVDQFHTDVVAVQKNTFDIRYALKPIHGLKPQSSTTVKMYICQKEWFDIEELAEVRNSSFAHSEAAKVDAVKLRSIVQRVERIYTSLSVPAKVVSAMKAIEQEPIAAKSVVDKIEFYREQWMIEHKHYKEVTRDVGEVRADVHQLKTQVRDISETIIPETQKEMDSMKKELQEGVKVREEIMTEAAEAKQGVMLAKEEIHTVSSEMKHNLKQASNEIEEQRRSLDHHTQELNKHEEKLEKTISVMTTKQTNVASRVSYALQEITHLSKDHKRTDENVKQVENRISVISEAERQLSDEVVKTKGIIQQMSVTEEDRVKHVALLEHSISSIEEKLQEFKSVGKLHVLDSSNFTADVRYHVKQYHSDTRQWLLDDIENWRVQSATKKVKLCLVTGNPGMGKSVLASQLCTVASGREALAACFFFQHHKTRRNNPKTLVQTLAYQFCFEFSQYKELIDKHLSEDFITRMNACELFTDLVLEPLHKITGISERKVIVIDGLDECDFEARDELLKLILREFVKLPEWIGVIMTTRPEQKILKRLSRIKPVFELNPDDPRNISDIKLYIGDILKGKLPNEEIETGMEIMVKKSEGMFLYFHYATEAIIQHDTLSLDDLKSLLPDGIDDFYEQNVRRLSNKLGKEKYQLLFQAITAARSDFPQALVSPLLDISSVESAQILETVSVLLPVSNECVSLFHKSIRDWLTDEDLAEDLVIDSNAGHRKLSALCYEKFKSIKRNTEMKLDSPVAKYVIENLVYHFCSPPEPSLTMELCNIVSDLQYMYYKLVLSRSAKDLIDDISDAKKVISECSKSHQTLKVCASFVHRYAQILGSMPQLVFQCALNDPQDMASHLGLEQYRENPAQNFPGLLLYLELINKPQNLASAITEYHCESKITSLTKSPDGKHLICSDSEGKMYIWDKQTGDLLQEMVMKGRNFLFPITSCSVSPDGNLILFGDLAEAVTIDGATVPFIEDAKSDKVNTAIFSPNCEFVLAWSYYADGLFHLLSEIGMNFQERHFVQIWNRKTGNSVDLEVTRRNEARPFCACFSSESAYVACGHKDGWIIIWETSTNKPKAMLYSDGTIVRNGPFKRAQTPIDNPIHDISYSPNDHYLAACHNEGVTIWDAPSLNFIQKLALSSDELKDAKCYNCTFSADSKNVIAGLSNGYIHAWTKQSGPEGPFVLRLSTKPHGASDPIVACFLDDDNQTVVCAIRSTICIYSYDSLLKNPPLEALAVHPKYATNCAILPDGRTALTCGNGSMCSWNVINARCISSAQTTVEGHLIKMSADGKLALTFGVGCVIQVWETDTLTKRSSLYTEGSSQSETDDPDSSSPHEVCYCAVSIHGTVVGGTGKGDLYIWHGEENSVKIIKEHQALINCIQFSSEGDCFVSGDMEGFIIMWKVAYNEDQVELIKVPMQRHEDDVEQVIFSPGQLQRIVSCGSDKRLHMYNSLTGDIIHKMEGHSSQVLKIAYSASGEYIVSGDGKSQLILWDGFTGQLIRQFDSFSGHLILNLCFSAEDEYVCTRDSNHDFVRVYSVSTGKCVSQIDFSSPISTFAASSLKAGSHSHMICGLKDGSIKCLRMCKK